MAQWLALNSKAMVPMPIHTAATDKQEYVRVISSLDDTANHLIGKVGQVTDKTNAVRAGAQIIFVNIDDSEKVFHHFEIEYITKKEYFKGCLGG